MVGVCGAIGSEAGVTDAMRRWVRRHDGERAFRYEDDELELWLSAHPLLAGEQPATAETDGTLCWLWGDVYGYGSGGDYTPRSDGPGGSAAFCARRYDEDGPEFVAGLNGEFALVCYDRESESLSVATDRLATRPVFWSRPSPGTVVFASSLEAALAHPDVVPSFERRYLQEYLTLRRVFGVETPIAGVREVQPGSVRTVDLGDPELATRTRSYWRPTYEPVEAPAEHYVERLTETLGRVLAEWTDGDLEYGLLLSGGSDSRFVEACIDQSVTAFHAAGWMSREARTARRVAETAGDEFRLLTRGDDHTARTFASTAGVAEYSGWFDQAYFTPFADRIRDEADVLVSGLFADTLFGDGALPTRRQSLGPLGTLSLPIACGTGSVANYLDSTLGEAEPVPYLDTDRDLRDVLAAELRRTEGGIVSHGVEYGSLTDLVMYGDYYPIGADTEAIFPRSLAQIRPTRTPFLDNRLLDLQQRVPKRFLLRRNLVDAGLERVSPALAAIPHAGTGVPPKYPFPIEYVGGNLTALYRKHVREESPPASHLGHEPWPDRRELLRSDGFAARTIREHESLIRRLSGFDYDAAEAALRAHRDGTDRQVPVYSLLTLLGMPHVRRMGGEADRMRPPIGGVEADVAAEGTPDAGPVTDG